MYYRVTAYKFDPSKYDAMMAYADNMKGQVRSIRGLTFVHTCRTGEDEGMVIGQYESEAAADAAQQEVNSVWAGLGQYMTSPPQVHAGEVIWRSDD